MSKPIKLNSYVGFDTITQQLEAKMLKRGYSFNIMLVGRSGLGKSTFVNTLFSGHLVDSNGQTSVKDFANTSKTTELISTQHLIEENGVCLKVIVTDSPGYGDQVNNDNCWEPIVKYIKDQYATYLRKELTPVRERNIPDTRVHCVLFFVSPTGHSLSPLDILVMKKISEVANVIPVIAKSDSLTMEERQSFKERIRDEILFHGIKVFFPAGSTDSSAVRIDESQQEVMDFMQATSMPFCVVGSERSVVVDGRAVRGRRTRFGLVNIENEEHCEFIKLRDFITRKYLVDLIEFTTQNHYESFRSRQLLALKEQSANGAGSVNQSKGALKEVTA